MENYALYLLENALRQEIIAQEQGLSLANGSTGYYSEAGRIAFAESLKLANERIPQLQDAISKIKA
jgi:hypothetical protein